MPKKKQEMSRRLTVDSEILVSGGRVTEMRWDRPLEGKTFIGNLQVEIRYHCGICHDMKILKYVIMKDEDRILSVCKECRDDIVRSEHLTGEDSKG
jgi:hypothetical protein